MYTCKLHHHIISQGDPVTLTFDPCPPNVIVGLYIEVWPRACVHKMQDNCMLGSGSEPMCKNDFSLKF